MSTSQQSSEGECIKTYRKVSKFWDARKICCNLPKTQTKRPNLRVFHQKDVNGIANSEDPVKIWVCTVCPELSVRKLRIIKVFCFSVNQCLKLCCDTSDMEILMSTHMII